VNIDTFVAEDQIDSGQTPEAKPPEKVTSSQPGAARKAKRKSS
jgi:hypothetical protein